MRDVGHLCLLSLSTRVVSAVRLSLRIDYLSHIGALSRMLVLLIQQHDLLVVPERHSVVVCHVLYHTFLECLVLRDLVLHLNVVLDHPQLLLSDVSLDLYVNENLAYFLLFLI